MQLSSDQQQAADKFLEFLLDPTESEMALMGHAGTGKTFLTSHLLDLANSKSKLLRLLTGGSDEVQVKLTASTNKAASVLAEKVGQSAQTIHSLLGLRVTNDFSNGKTTLKKSAKTAVITNTLIILDEASMVDKVLLKVIRELTHECKILYILDPYQLAPVFEESCPVAESVKNRAILTTIQRQSKGNPIIELSDKLRSAVKLNQFPHLTPAGASIIHATGPEFQHEMEQAFQVTGRSNDHLKVLAWTNAKVHQYNSHIRNMIVGHDEYIIGETLVTNNPIIIGGMVSRATDTTLVIKDINPAEAHGIAGNWISFGSDHRVFIANNQWEVTQLTKQLAKQKDWVTYFAMKEFFTDLRPIHASTVHKSQGSTYNTVFIDLTDIGTNTKWNEVARMLYVAITRASNKVVLYGSLPTRYTPDGTS